MPRIRMNVKKPEIRKYPTLTANFFRGSTKGKIISVYRTRDTNPGKVVDFAKAIVAGDCVLDLDAMTDSDKRKLAEMGIELV